MPILTEQRKRQKNLITVMSLVMVITITVLYFGFFRRGGGEQFLEEGGAEIIKGAREVRLNLGVFTEERFKDLIPYDKLPKDIKTGRNNPFIPYSESEPVYIIQELIEPEEIEPAPNEATTTTPTTDELL